MRPTAQRTDWHVAEVYKDYGAKGAMGGGGRRALSRRHQGANHAVMAWRRSLKDLGRSCPSFALDIDRFLHQQGLDPTRQQARPCFRCSAVKRSGIQERLRKCNGRQDWRRIFP
jgi:hypothetical protein